ncbi:MAG: gliding motility-associated C-terminal domain-containing protein [Chitinophagaceae bacterium]|nr:MAG: gliding motility-associated C-terminal domain-containing protein [Chitinophagaceae bacterium]
MHQTLFSRLFTLIICMLPFLAISQPCTTLGQTPATAFPVCGTASFTQDNVPICNTNEVYVPGCQNGTTYENKNPFWYKFTCFQAGTIGFAITPTDLTDDYDWQLYDITGVNPDEVFTNRTIIVSGNWSGSSGITGAGAQGTNNMECSSSPDDNVNTFSRLINLTVGHEYILLVSHYTNSQSGYSLNFGEGTAVITDPAQPHLLSVKPDCDGVQLRVKLNKKMKCNSLTATGSEFSILPAGVTVTGAQPLNCNGAFDFDSVLLTLSGPLGAGTYSLLVNDGSDANTILDNCSTALPQGESMSFEFIVPQPIYADSIGTVGCAPSELHLYFPKRINCATLDADGSDFVVTGPSAVTVTGAVAQCTDNFTTMVTIRFAAPIVNRGTYTLTLRTGNDGSSIIDECGIEMPLQSLDFNCADTVSADFTYSLSAGCRQNQLTFTHNGANQVSSWNWTAGTFSPGRNAVYQITVPSTSTHSIKLQVSNGTCTDSVTQVIVLENEVKADFDMPAIICPEDPLQVVNQSSGIVDRWTWQFERISTDTARDPAPVLFPTTNREAYYTIRLRAENVTLGCADSIRKTVRVLANCFIAVPSGFTPNNDGINDFLYPNNAFKAENLEFRVFNRWGQLVFLSREWTAKWDGTVNGIPQGSGVYVWFLRYTNRETGQHVSQKGTTTLIR